jgi:uncharacterized protein YndB with AHSA1/START domain
MTVGHVAKQQAVIDGSLEEVWRLLTEPAELSNWFAQISHFGVEKSFTFAFGDGDFFAGQITDWNPPYNLGLIWRFMNLGPVYHIRFKLSEVEDGVQVAVEDTGSLSADEAQSLTMGWEDFLQRLARYARTGENSRYEWSQEISVTVTLSDKEKPSLMNLLSEHWWSENFTEAKLALLDSDIDRAVWLLCESNWVSETTVKLVVAKYYSNWFLTITHQGWEEILPPPANIAARKRYAHLWHDALRLFESR